MSAKTVNAIVTKSTTATATDKKSVVATDKKSNRLFTIDDIYAMCATSDITSRHIKVNYSTAKNQSYTGFTDFSVNFKSNGFAVYMTTKLASDCGITDTRDNTYRDRDGKPTRYNDDGSVVLRDNTRTLEKLYSDNKSLVTDLKKVIAYKLQ